MTSTEAIYVIHGLDTRKYYDSISRIMQLDASLTSHYFEGNSILLHIISMLFSDVDFHEADTNKLSIIDEIKFYFDINFYNSAVFFLFSIFFFLSIFIIIFFSSPVISGCSIRDLV